MKEVNVYVVHDIIRDEVVLGGVDYTDNRFAMYAMEVYGKHARLAEFQIFRVAKYDGVNVTPIPREFVPWSVAAIKETSSENLQLVGASDFEKEADFIQTSKAENSK